MVAANAINRNQRQYPASSYILIGQEYHQILEESLKNIGTFDHNPIRVYQDPIDDILRNGIDFINFNTDEIGERRPYWSSSASIGSCPENSFNLSMASFNVNDP